jgi:hypothetical protein
MTKLDFQQIIEACYDEPTKSLNIVILMGLLTNKKSKLDFQQIFRETFNETLNGLKVIEVP